MTSDGRGVITPSARRALAVFASCGALLSSYLTASHVLGKHASVPGCHDCAEVVTSRWGSVLGVPVGVPATAGYAIALSVLLAPRLAAFRDSVRTLRILAVLGVTLTAGAVWFVSVQASLGRMCGFCMFTHAVGVVFALVAWATAARAGAFHGADVGYGAVAGLMPVAALVVLQHVAAPAYVSEASAASVSAAPAGLVKLPGTEIELRPREHLVHGSVTAPRMLVEVIDFTCPRCARVQKVLASARASLGDAYAVLVVPFPLDQACNPSGPSDDPKHRGACVFARLAHAVNLADPSRYPTFHDALFARQGQIDESSARALAAELVGAARLDEILASGEPDRRVQRDVAIATKLAEKRGGHLPDVYAGASHFEEIPDDPSLIAWLVRDGFDRAGTGRR